MGGAYSLSWIRRGRWSWLGSIWRGETRISRGWDDRKVDKGGLIRRVIDALGSLAVVDGFCPENVGDEGLRVAVIQREPAGLDLHHDAMAGKEDVVGSGQNDAIGERLVGFDG